MSDADTVIETYGLTKRYSGGVLAVDRLDLRVPRGEVRKARSGSSTFSHIGFFSQNVVAPRV